ncbi:hypothetical protein N9P38_01015 [Flavobacteriales bacterium]|nr:hypothetical protein [Flavobacteriales bacterium]
MKKLIYLFVGLLLISSCGNESELQAQLETMKQENEDLKIQNEQISEKDVLITEYSQFILDVQSNLDQIRNRENTVLLPKSGDAIVQTPEQIKEDLQQLGALLADNKKKISSMKTKLSNSNIQMDDLEKVIRNLSAKAEQREVKILGMKGELSDMGVAFDELMAAYENNIEVIADKNETIESQDNLLHTAYYAFGSKKELKENNVITAEGGLIGIGKTKKLKDDFNKDYFTEVNTKELTEIPMGVKKAEIITTHPAGSYELVGDGNVEKIKILDSEKFWSVSKYLVVVTK